MSEYWKSTPKYYCKYCKDYFKDTKFERQQHESTPRHQGNIQRSLRTLHRAKEQEDREKQRAQNEIARLNGVVAGKAAGGAPSAPIPLAISSKGLGKEASKPVSAEERKKQIKQLAEMGIAVPEEYRREMALAGDWQTVSVRPVGQDDISHLKADRIAFGVHKRKLEDEAEEQAAEAAAAVKQKQWGSKFKTYPGKKSRIDDGSDVEALLSVIVPKTEVKQEDGETKQEQAEAQPEVDRSDPVDEQPAIKKEESTNEDEVAAEKSVKTLGDIPVRSEEGPSVESEPISTGVVFKKRKPKVVRQTGT